MFFKQPCKINSLPVPCSLCNALFGLKMLKKKHITFVFTERLRKTNSIHSTVNIYIYIYICVYSVLKFKDCICFCALVKHFKIKINELSIL